MEYIHGIVIKEEKLSEDEEPSASFEDEEKLFMDAPIKIEYPEDDNYEPTDSGADFEIPPVRCMIPEVRKRQSETSDISVIKKQKLRDDKIQLEKIGEIGENKTHPCKTDFGSQTNFSNNGYCLKDAAKAVDVACQTEISAERAEMGCQTELSAERAEMVCQTVDSRRSVDVGCQKDDLTEAVNLDATGLSKRARKAILKGARDSSESVSCTDLEEPKTKEAADTDPHLKDEARILPEDMLIGLEKSPQMKDTTKDVFQIAKTLSLALCKGLIQTLKPKTVPKPILYNLSREVVTSVREALSKTLSPEALSPSVESPVKASKAVTEDAPESKFTPVKVPDTTLSKDRIKVEEQRESPQKTVLQPLSVPSGGLKEDPSLGLKEEPSRGLKQEISEGLKEDPSGGLKEELESSEVAYSQFFCNGSVLTHRCWNCTAAFLTKKKLRKHYLYFCTKKKGIDESSLEQNYLYWCGYCGIYHNCSEYEELTAPLQ